MCITCLIADYVSRRLVFLCVFALLVSNAAGCLASGLAGCLALAAAAVLTALYKVFCFDSLNSLHFKFSNRLIFEGHKKPLKLRIKYSTDSNHCQAFAAESQGIISLKCEFISTIKRQTPPIYASIIEGVFLFLYLKITF